MRGHHSHQQPPKPRPRAHPVTRGSGNKGRNLPTLVETSQKMPKRKCEESVHLQQKQTNQRGSWRRECMPKAPAVSGRGRTPIAGADPHKATLGQMQPGGKARWGAQLPALSLHRSNTTDAQESTGPSNPGPLQTKGVEHLPLRGRVAQHCHPGVSGDNAMTCQKRKARAQQPERKRRASKKTQARKEGKRRATRP